MIKSQKFSFYLSDSSRDSSLILDDISNYAFFKQIYKKMSFCTVKTSVDNWECDLNSVEIEKQTIIMNSRVSFDTGTSYILIPAMNFMQIKPKLIDSIKASCAFTENLNQLVCKCSSPKIFPLIKLNINGNQLEINPINIIDFEPNNDYQCRFQILISPKEFDHWILGDSALRGLLFSFDVAKRTVGFTNAMPNFPVNINDDINKAEEDNQDVKIYYMFALLFILAGVAFLYKCANNENFLASLAMKDPKKKGAEKLLITENKFEKNDTNMISLDFKNFDLNDITEKKNKNEEK